VSTTARSREADVRAVFTGYLAMIVVGLVYLIAIALRNG
jgi:hypothetical protein